nr:hypothetical protein [Photobacterium kishitanii]
MHRELASGLSCPAGFKNGTDGNIKNCNRCYWLQLARPIISYLSLNMAIQLIKLQPRVMKIVILYYVGGKAPNYGADDVNKIMQQLVDVSLRNKLMIDFSHAISSKQYQRQVVVSADVGQQIANGSNAIFGVMIESHLVEGRQDIVDGENTSVWTKYYRCPYLIMILIKYYVNLLVMSESVVKIVG